MIPLVIIKSEFYYKDNFIEVISVNYCTLFLIFWTLYLNTSSTYIIYIHDTCDNRTIIIYYVLFDLLYRKELFARNTPNKHCLRIGRRWIHNLYYTIRVYRIYFKLGRAFVVLARAAHEIPRSFSWPLCFFCTFSFPFKRSLWFTFEPYCRVEEMFRQKILPGCVL